LNLYVVYRVDCADEIVFDKTTICDLIEKHGGILLKNFDLAAVRLVSVSV